jgi:hypothetical protein
LSGGFFSERACRILAVDHKRLVARKALERKAEQFIPCEGYAVLARCGVAMISRHPVRLSGARQMNHAALVHSGERAHRKGGGEPT